MDEPGVAEGVVVLEGVEFVPAFFYAVDFRFVGAVQGFFELEEVGGIGEEGIDTLGGELWHCCEAVAVQDTVEDGGEGLGECHAFVNASFVPYLSRM